MHAECARKDLEEEFWAYCHTDENSDRVGELAFGTNPGIIPDDWDFAAGREISRGAYCVWRSVWEPDSCGLESRTHVGCVDAKCDVWIDAEQ